MNNSGLFKKEYMSLYGVMTFWTIIYFVIVFFMPKDITTGFWAFFFLDNYPWVIKLIFVFTPLVFTILSFSLLLKIFDRVDRKAISAKGHNCIKTIIMFIAFFVIFWFLREKRLWGDAEHIIKVLRGSIDVGPWSEYFWREPLDFILKVFFYKIFNGCFGWSAGKSIAFINCFLGSLFVVFLSHISKKIGKNGFERFFLFCFILFMGASVLFFGHIETYTLIYLLILIFFIVTIKYFNDECPLFIVGLCGAIAVSAHIMGIFLFAIVFLLPFIKNKKIKKEYFHDLKAPSLVAVCYLALFYVSCRILGAEPLSIGINEFGGDDHVFLSISRVLQFEHIWKVLQTFILASSIGIFVIGKDSIIRGLRALKEKDAIVIFLLAASVMYIGFSLCLSNKLERLKDWDLFAPGCLPAALLIGYLFLLVTRDSKEKKILGLFTLCVSLSFSSLWIWDNHKNDSFPFILKFETLEWRQKIYINYEDIKKERILYNKEFETLHPQFYNQEGNFTYQLPLPEADFRKMYLKIKGYVLYKNNYLRVSLAGEEVIKVEGNEKEFKEAKYIDITDKIKKKEKLLLTGRLFVSKNNSRELYDVRIEEIVLIYR